jgi:hypothetical protein
MSTVDPKKYWQYMQEGQWNLAHAALPPASGCGASYRVSGA